MSLDLDKLRKDLERVHPGGTYTIDARQLKELLDMAEAKADPWRMFRPPRDWQAWGKWVVNKLLEFNERLTALEEANPPPAEAPCNPSVPADRMAELEAKLAAAQAEHGPAGDAMAMLCRLQRVFSTATNIPSWEQALEKAIAGAGELSLLKSRMPAQLALEKAAREHQEHVEQMLHYTQSPGEPGIWAALKRLDGLKEQD